MSLFLTETDHRLLVAAQEAMVSPLAYEDRKAWMLDVNARLRAFTGADHTVAFFLDEGGFEYVSDDTDTGPLGPLDEMVTGWDEEGSARFRRTEDRAAFYFELFHRMRRAGGSGAYHDRQADVTREMKRTDRWQSMFASVGVRFMTGLSTPLRVGEVTTCVAYERETAEGYTDEGLNRLELLVPAYEAGVRAWHRMEGYLEMLDSVHQALAVLGQGGAVLFRSRALERLFRRDPMWSKIAAAMEDLARRVSRRAVGRSRKSEVRELTNRAEVATPGCSYTLSASPVSPAVFGTEGVLVQVERQGVFPPCEAIQARFALTLREAEVALLLAEGLDNRRIAERLSISPHTARRHTERVMRGLGIASRAAVAVTLLRSE